MAADDNAIYSAYLVAFARVRAGAGPTMTPGPVDANLLHLYAATAVGVLDALATSTTMKTKTQLLTAVATALT